MTSRDSSSSAVVLLLLVLSLGACARPPAAGVDGQWSRGAALYAAQCASCHEVSETLAPELEAVLLASYGSAEALFFYVQMSMPLQDPGSLSDEAYWAILAYVLAERGLRLADHPLDAINAAHVSLNR